MTVLQKVKIEQCYAGMAAQRNASGVIALDRRAAYGIQVQAAGMVMRR